MNRILATICFILISLNSYAYTRVFMLSKIDAQNLDLTIGDVTRIEGEDASRFSSIKIPQFYLKDLMIDKNELKTLLSDKGNSDYYIAGSGIRINLVSKLESEFPKPSGLIKRGSLIKLVIKKRNVNLEIYGTVEIDTSPGETVIVKLPSGKKITGVVISRRKVLVEL